MEPCCRYGRFNGVSDRTKMVQNQWTVPLRALNKKNRDVDFIINKIFRKFFIRVADPDPFIPDGPIRTSISFFLAVRSGPGYVFSWLSDPDLDPNFLRSQIRVHFSRIRNPGFHVKVMTKKVIKWLRSLFLISNKKNTVNWSLQDVRDHEN